MLTGVVTVSSQTASADTYSCKRYSDDINGFISFTAYESWFPKKITLNTNKGQKDGNQFVFKKTSHMKGVGNHQRVHRTRLLPNGIAISGLEDISGFRQAGKARYRCENITEKYWDSENNRPRNLTR